MTNPNTKGAVKDVFMSVIIDLFSGSGSATGIWENMGHEVWRYDIVAPKPGPDTIPLDLSNLSSCDAIINHHKNIEKITFF